MNNNFLITGSFGLLGSNFAIKLLKKIPDAKIFLIDKDKKKNKFFNINNVNFHYLNINFNNKKKITEIIKKKKFKCIFHFGAITQVNEGIDYPYETLNTNIFGTINILESIRKYSRKTFLIFSSTDKAYGKMKKKKYTETDPLQGDFIYDVSKSCSDLICQSYARVYNLKIAIVRSGNIYGPGDLNLKRIVPEAIKNILKNKELKLRSNGKLTRDYIFVDDVCNAYYQIYNKYKSSIKNLFIYNLGSKNNLSVLELVKIIFKSLNKKIKIKINNNSKFEIKDQKLNYNKIKNDLGWEPKINLKNGLIKTANWYKKIFY